MQLENDLTLTVTEKLWMQRVLDSLYIDYEYVISWHLRQIYGEPTNLINYHLSKLAKKGYLLKEAHKSYTKFHLTELSKKYIN